MILVTGYPRSGTGYAAKLLNGAGVGVGHETVKEDGAVSWLHIASGSVPWLEGEIETTEWSKVIHLVRCPLDVLSSAQTLSDAAFDYMFRFLGEHPGGERGLRWYMWTFLKWTALIEAERDYYFRVEDLKDPAVLKILLSITGGTLPDLFVLPPTNVNSRAHPHYTWLDLELADPELSKEILELTAKYGYSTFRFGAVMMAKDEARNLDRCLSSIRGIVDEIILIDTGSTDDTVAIAQSYGARIFHSPWRDSFSFHRNESLNYSSCDWVIQIDCDEELVGDTTQFRTFVEAVSKSKYNAMAVLLRDIHQGRTTMQFNAARIFKRGAVHFEDIVHNRPVFVGDAAMSSDEPVFWLHHYGYDLTPEKKAAKLDRTKRLLLKRITDNPKDADAYFYLSQVEGELGNTEEVLHLCETYIQYRDICTKFNRSVFYTHLQALEAIKGLGEEYEAALHKYMNELPNDLDITFTAIEYAAKVKNIKLLRTAAEKFVELYSVYLKDSHTQASRFVYTSRPECLATALFYASTLAFSTGIEALKSFSAVLPKTMEGYKNRAIEDMHTACNNLGITWKYIQREEGV